MNVPHHFEIYSSIYSSDGTGTLEAQLFTGRRWSAADPGLDTANQSAQARLLIERSFRLQNLAANLPAGIYGCVEIEIPLTIHQLLSLFRGDGRHTINGTCYLAHPFHSKVAGRVRNRKLWLRIRPRRRWSMKVRRDDWTSQPTELNVIFEFVGFSVQRGPHSSSTRRVIGRNLA
jgi:hypothetical protein